MISIINSTQKYNAYLLITCSQLLQKCIFKILIPLLLLMVQDILLLDMGMWGMYSVVKANEKHDGGNENILGSSGDPLS